MALRINGQAVEPQGGASTTLLEVIRDQMRIKGTKVACERGECGSCTVLVNGVPMVSCIQLACLTDGEVTTVEGLAESERDLREAFAEFGGFQCGFCTSGQVVHAAAVLRELAEVPDVPDLDAFIRHRMSGNLCRCTGYAGIIEAIVVTHKRRKGELIEGMAA